MCPWLSPLRSRVDCIVREGGRPAGTGLRAGRGHVAFGAVLQPQSVLGLAGEFGSDRSLRRDKDHAMRIGISLTSNFPEVKEPRQGARWMIERAAAARRAGL